MRDLADASVYESYALPKMYYKVYYSVSAAIHLRYAMLLCDPVSLIKLHCSVGV